MLGKEIPTDEFVPITDVVDEQMIMAVAMQSAEEGPQKKEIVNNIASTIHSICVRRLEDDSSDLPEVDMEQAMDPDAMNEQVMESILHHAGEVDEFDGPVPVFRIQNIAFAFKAKNREECLNQVMDFAVEEENYEQAAVARDLLDT